MQTWTYQDYEAGNCSPSDVGQPKEPSTPPIPISAINVKQDFLEAYRQAGGVEYLVKFSRINPQKFLDLLAKVTADPPPQPLTLATITYAELEKLSIPQLIQLYAGSNVIDVTPGSEGSSDE